MVCPGFGVADAPNDSSPRRGWGGAVKLTVGDVAGSAAPAGSAIVTRSATTNATPAPRIPKLGRLTPNRGRAVMGDISQSRGRRARCYEGFIQESHDQ